MRQRGRQSSASLSVIHVDGRPSRLEPPHYLNATEAAAFVELASTAGHFVPTDTPLVAQATVMARKAARDQKKLSVWERAVRMQIALATKLRLTPQSRIDPKTVGRQQPRGIVPWEWERNDTRTTNGA